MAVENGNKNNNKSVKHLINSFFSIKDLSSREAGIILIDLSLAIFNYLKKTGKIKRMKEYDYMCADEDILQDICRCLIQYRYKHNPVLNPQKKPSFKDLVDTCKEIFTSVVQDRCCEIDRVIDTGNGRIVVSDREFQNKFKRKYKTLNSTSKRNTKSVSDFYSEEDNNRDFFERRMIENQYFPSPEEILLMNCEEEFQESKQEQEESSLMELVKIVKSKVTVV